jgi:hypothetical protein
MEVDKMALTRTASRKVADLEGLSVDEQARRELDWRRTPANKRSARIKSKGRVVLTAVQRMSTPELVKLAGTQSLADSTLAPTPVVAKTNGAKVTQQTLALGSTSWKSQIFARDDVKNHPHPRFVGRKAIANVYNKQMSYDEAVADAIAQAERFFV